MLPYLDKMCNYVLVHCIDHRLLATGHRISKLTSDSDSDSDSPARIQLCSSVHQSL